MHGYNIEQITFLKLNLDYDIKFGHGIIINSSNNMPIAYNFELVAFLPTISYANKSEAEGDVGAKNNDAKFQKLYFPDSSIFFFSFSCSYDFTFTLI